MHKTSRTIMIVLAAFLLALGIALCGIHIPQARADSTLSIDINFGFASLAYGTEAKILGVALTEEGRLYGNIVGTEFNPNADGTYYILFKNLVARANYEVDEEVPVFRKDSDNKWKVCLPVAQGEKSTVYYFSGDKLPSYSYKLYHGGFKVYLAEDDSETDYEVNFSKNEKAKIRVFPRELTIELTSVRDSEDNVVETRLEDGVTYIPHNYGDEPLHLTFGPAEGSSLLFDATLSSGDVIGNTNDAHVGTYQIDSEKAITQTADIRLDGVSVTSCYKLSTPGSYTVEVLPVHLPIKDNEDYEDPIVETKQFSPKAGQDGVSALSFCKEYKVADFLGDATQFAGSYVRVAYDVDPASNPYVEGKEAQWIVNTNAEGHPLRVVAIECGSYDLVDDQAIWIKSENNDYVVEMSDLPDGCVLKVTPRLVTVYNPLTYPDPDSLPKDELDPSTWSPVDAAAMTTDYGTLYTSAAFGMGMIDVDGETLAIEGCIVDIVGHLAGKESVRLSVDAYHVEDLAVKDDPHYTITADESVMWTITPYLISFDQNDANKHFPTSEEGEDPYATVHALSNESLFARFLDGYKVHTGFAVGAIDYTTAIAALGAYSCDVVIKTEFDGVVEFTCWVDARPLPGYHAVTRITQSGMLNPNYAIDADYLYVKVNSISYSVDAGSVVYDGEPHAVGISFSGGFGAADPFAAEFSCGISSRYNGNEIVPTLAGTYTVVVSAVQPDREDKLYNLPFYKRADDNTQFSFTIQKCAITVRVAIKRDNRDFATSISISDIYERVFINKKDLDVDLSEQSDLVTVSCDATRFDVLPGSYKINVSVNNSNYSLAEQDISALGEGKTMMFRVNPMTKSQLEGVLSTAVKGKGTDYIEMTAPSYNSVLISGFGVRYREQSEEGWTQGNLRVSGLEEGDKYYLQLYMSPSQASVYLDSYTEVAGSIVNACTDMTLPVLKQKEDETKSTKIAITITNYVEGNTYLVTLDDEEVPDNRCRIVDDTIYLTAMDPHESYYVYVTMYSAKVDGLWVDSEEILVYTRAAAPDLARKDISVSASSVKVPDGYMYYVIEYPTDADPIDTPLSWQEALNLAGSPLDEFTYQEAMNNAIEGGTALRDLTRGKRYLVLVWQEGDADSGELVSDITVYWIVADSWLPKLWDGAMAYIAKYLLVGIVGLMVVLTIVLTIVFVCKRKKLSKR